MTRGARFRAARMNLNQHGEQTVQEVAKAVGVAKSMISELELDHYDRNIGYEKVSAIARYYGVDVVWLMEGQKTCGHESPPLATAAEYTGLSAAAVDQLRRLACDSLSQVASAFIENKHFISILIAVLHAVDATVKSDEAEARPQAGDENTIKAQVAQESNGRLSAIDTRFLPATYQYLAEYHLSNLIADLSYAAKNPLNIEQIVAEAKALSADKDPYIGYDKRKQYRAEIHEMVDNLNK